ncbi:MAG: hypothetical protein GDA36_08225 [Rhodobacteraceae bacterium]|nr:hypothetical protein [Paracoccaceae bacterium]
MGRKQGSKNVTFDEAIKMAAYKALGAESKDIAEIMDRKKQTVEKTLRKMEDAVEGKDKA